MNAQSIYDTQFAHCPRSPEWKAGALYGLKVILREPCQTGSPYTCGTAADDAWRAGVQEGLAEGRQEAKRLQREKAQQTEQRLSADVLHGIGHAVHQSLAPAPAPVPHGPTASQAQAVPCQCAATQPPVSAAAPAQPGANGEPAAPAGCGLLPDGQQSEGWSMGCRCACSFPEVV